MRPYLGPPWTNSCQIWCVRVFYHVLLKYCHENAEMQKKENLMTSHFSTLLGLCFINLLVQKEEILGMYMLPLCNLHSGPWCKTVSTRELITLVLSKSISRMNSRHHQMIPNPVYERQGRFQLQLLWQHGLSEKINTTVLQIVRYRW